MCQTSENCSIELRIARAYVRLSFAPQDNNGLKTVSLARIGSYEVWLSEFAQGHADCDAQFWVELYDLKSPCFCLRSQAENWHVLHVLPLGDEFREGIERDT